MTDMNVETLESRDELMRGLRPEQEFAPAEENTLKRFQEETLFPILKIQHELIIAQVKNYLSSLRTPFTAFGRSSQVEILKKAFEQDLGLKNGMVYSVVGLFTLEEYAFYNRNTYKVGKWIRDGLLQHLKGHMEQLYG